MTQWAYLIVHDPGLASFDEIKQFLNARPEIKNWYKAIPNTVFVISDATASSLAKLLADRFPNRHPFLVLDVATDKAGLLPADVWEFLSDKPSPAKSIEKRTTLLEALKNMPQIKNDSPPPGFSMLQEILRKTPKPRKP